MGTPQYRFVLPREYSVVDLPGFKSFIVRIEWQLWCQDGSIETNPGLPSYGKLRDVAVGGVLNFDPPATIEGLVPFEQVDEALVLKWLDTIDAEEIGAKKTMLKLALEEAERDANPLQNRPYKRFLTGSPEYQAIMRASKVQQG